MLIAIISDIHDNLANLSKCLGWCRLNGISQIICCGDVTNEDTITFLSKNFSSHIDLISGNMEIYDPKILVKHKNIDYWGRYGAVKIENDNIGICHEPFFADKILEEFPQVKIIFCGHTHKPWMEKIKGVSLINPGTLGGVFNKATFSVFDTSSHNLELKILELL